MVVVHVFFLPSGALTFIQDVMSDSSGCVILTKTHFAIQSVFLLAERADSNTNRKLILEFVVKAFMDENDRWRRHVTGPLLYLFLSSRVQPPLCPTRGVW